MNATSTPQPRRGYASPAEAEAKAKAKALSAAADALLAASAGRTTHARPGDGEAPDAESDLDIESVPDGLPDGFSPSDPAVLAAQPSPDEALAMVPGAGEPGYDGLFDEEYELLPRPVERELAKRWRDHRDSRARDRLIGAYQRLVVALASRASRGGLPMEDLVQEANIGLIYALDRFDPDLGWGFGTFARYHVISRIQVYTLENVAPMRIFNTATTKALLSRYGRIRREIESETGAPLDDEGREEMCRRLLIDREHLDRFEMTMAPAARVDQGAGNAVEDESRATALADQAPLPDEEAMSRHASAQVSSILGMCMDRLGPRERRIVVARHMSDPPMTLDALSREFNISRERVRQIELRAMREMAKEFRAHGISGADDILFGI